MGERFKKKGINPESLSQEFKKLIFRLLCYNPEQRMTIEELDQDEWFISSSYSRNKTRKELALSYM